MECTLVGKSRKGETRVKDVKAQLLGWNGAWRVLQTMPKVAFSQDSGPWLLVEPKLEDEAQQKLQAAKVDRLSRWVHQDRDADFFVIVSAQVQAL